MRLHMTMIRFAPLTSRCEQAWRRSQGVLLPRQAIFPAQWFNVADLRRSSSDRVRRIFGGVTNLSALFAYVLQTCMNR